MIRKLFLMTVIVLCLALTLSSCSVFWLINPKSVGGVWNRIGVAMGKVESYEYDISVKLAFLTAVESDEKALTTIDLNGKCIIDGEEYFYQSSVTETENDKLWLDEKIESVIAYSDGKVYSYNVGESLKQKIYSYSDYEHFSKYVISESDGDIDLIDANTSSVESHEDGSWTISFSDYSDEEIDDISEIYGIDSGLFGDDVDDMNVTILADKDYHLKQLKLDYIFSDDAEQRDELMASVCVDYVSMGEVTRVYDKIDGDDLKKVDDVTVLFRLTKALEDLKDSNYVSFNMKMEQETSINGRKTEYSESSNVSFGEGDNGYYYDIDSVINGESYKIQYEDGEQTVTGSVDSEVTEIDEEAARAFMETIVDPSFYNSSSIVDVKDLGDGKYELICHEILIPSVKTTVQALKMRYTTGTQTITVTFDEDKLVSLESYAVGNGQNNVQGTMVYGTLRVKTVNNYS